MNCEGDKAILHCLSGPPQSLPSTTEVDSKWTVRSDFDTHRSCRPRTNGRFAPPKLSRLHLGANGRGRLKRRLSALSGKLRFGNYKEASFVR